MGLYLDEFEIGRVYHGEVCRTVTEGDVSLFAGLTMDYNPLHMDEEFGKTTPFGRRVAHGMLGACIASGLTNMTGLVSGTTLALIEMTFTFKAPIHFGDTVHVDLIPQSVRPSSKDPKKGMLKLQCNLINQRGEVVTECLQTVLMKTLAAKG